MLSTNNLLKLSLLFRFGCEILKNSTAALKEKEKLVHLSKMGTFENYAT